VRLAQKSGRACGDRDRNDASVGIAGHAAQFRLTDHAVSDGGERGTDVGNHRLRSPHLLFGASTPARAPRFGSTIRPWWAVDSLFHGWENPTSHII
jgi:hypothetical protein